MISIFRVQGREKEVINSGNEGLGGKRERVGCFTRQTSFVSEKARCRDFDSPVAGGAFHRHNNRKNAHILYSLQRIFWIRLPRYLL